MPKKIIRTNHAPAAIGPYSQAVMVDGMVFCSGQIALVPETGELVTGNIEAETEQVLKNLTAVLAEAGAMLDDVVKTTVYLKDMADYPAVNEVYAKHFTGGEGHPARACVEVSRLPKDVSVEIDAIAIIK